MNSYETVFILTPVLSDEQAKEAVQKFEGEITSKGGKIKHSESWVCASWPTQSRKNQPDFISSLNLKLKATLLQITN